MTKGNALTIEELINIVAAKEENRIPLRPIHSKEADNLLRKIRARSEILGDLGLPWEEFIIAFIRTSTKMDRGSARYIDICLLVEYAGPFIIGLIDEDLRDEISSLLISLHDRYVLEKSLSSNWVRSNNYNESEGSCIRCGQCCIGPAEGPLSWRDDEILKWEIGGRDDILYFTASGSPYKGRKARTLEFLVCPFLRFETPLLGLCLIHPVKPWECIEFSCKSFDNLSEQMFSLDGSKEACHEPLQRKSTAPF